MLAHNENKTASGWRLEVHDAEDDWGAQEGMASTLALTRVGACVYIQKKMTSRPSTRCIAMMPRER